MSGSSQGPGPVSCRKQRSVAPSQASLNECTAVSPPRCTGAAPSLTLDQAQPNRRLIKAELDTKGSPWQRNDQSWIASGSGWAWVHRHSMQLCSEKGPWERCQGSRAGRSGVHVAAQTCPSCPVTTALEIPPFAACGKGSWRDSPCNRHDIHRAPAKECVGPVEGSPSISDMGRISLWRT